MRILIVENERLTLTGIQQAVNWQRLGIEEVHLAQDGLYGLQIARAVLPEIILTDIRMPRMNGIEMTQCLRDLLPESSLLFMSAFTEKEMLMDAIEVSAEGWAEKPLNIDKLSNLIEKAVDHQRRQKKERSDMADLRENLEQSLSLLRVISRSDSIFASSIPKKLRDQLENSETETYIHPVINGLCQHVSANYHDPDLCLQSMADLLGVSIPYLCAIIKQELGCTFVEFLTSIRLENAKRLMQRSRGIRVRDVAEMVGYRDPNYFLKVFKKKVGVSPALYRVNKNE